MRKLSTPELNRLSVEDYREVKKNPCIVVLDNVRSLNNIGSIFRTADAFRVDELYLCGITACPPHREIHKTALGATDSVKWQYVDDTLEAIKRLKLEGYKIYAVEQTDESIQLQDIEIDINEKIAIVFGHEVQGISQEVVQFADTCIEIPQHGTKHSLNVAVCAGIVIWEVFKKFLKND